MRVKYLFSSRKTGRILGENNHTKPIPDIVREVIRISDVVLEIVDARFIEKTRNKELETYIRQQGKKIIYVINKIDLVEKSLLDEQRVGLEPYALVSCAKRYGIKDLRNRIKIEVKKLKIDKKGFKRAQIGIIGYPNTGKSSLINLFVGHRANLASPQAGLTKGMTLIKLTKEILLIDTPGVIPDKEQKMEHNTLNNRNMIKQAEIGVATFDKVRDPILVVTQLMLKNPGVMEQKYGMEKNDDPELFLEEFGKKRKMLLKGGKINLDLAARTVLKDWQKGFNSN